MLRLLNRHGVQDYSNLTLMEVGCGAGGNLLEFLRWGWEPSHLSGIELLPERALHARKVLPAPVKVIEGDACAARVEPGSVDIVFQSTVFSSLLDTSFQHRLADTMWSWVKPGGAVLWYDFCVDNPRNPDVAGVPMKRVRQLFPQAEADGLRVTLAPPVARGVCRLHPSLYRVFNALPWLRTHRLVWLGKPSGPSTPSAAGVL
jgi:SAM-dependent methyltransferase